MSRYEAEYEDEAYEDENEALDMLAYEAAEGPASKMGVNVALLLAFSSEGFQTTPRFRDDWFNRFKNANIRGVFRKLFCKADHFEVQRTVNGKRIWTKAAVVGGRPMLYSVQAGQKPLLGAIAPAGWHLTQVGRSIPTPKLPLCSRP
jgi:hypothetical protein